MVEEEYLVTALVPSDTACLASSPGRISRTLSSVSICRQHTNRRNATYEVWISRDEIVDFLLYAASFEASVATRSKMSEIGIRRVRHYRSGINLPLTKEFRMDMARLEIPVSG